MLLALGAASSAIDALQSLTSSKSTSPQTTGFTQSATTPFDTTSSQAQTGSPPPVTGGAGFTQISPATMSALIAAQGQASGTSATSTSTTSASTDPSSALKDLFSQLDADGDGKISKTEFESALGAGGTNLAQADKVFNKLDANGDGSVSLDEMSKALQGSHGKGGRHHHAAASDGSTSGASGPSAGGSNSDALLQALSGASSTAVTNGDGSTTTSVTYADGSKVTMTSPAASTTASSGTSSSSATSSYNMIEQMIQREAQAISSGATASLSMNV